MDSLKFATPEAEITALRRIVEELRDDLEDCKLQKVELELEIEKVHSDYERKLKDQIAKTNAISNESVNYKIKGDMERKANDRLQKEKQELQEQVEGYKTNADKQKRRIAELEIELEKSFNNERVLRDKNEQLEESQSSAMEKVADMETRLIEMEQRARDADYFPMPVRPAGINSNGIEVDTRMNGTTEIKKINATKKKESRNSAQVVDDLIGIIEKFEKLLFKEEDHHSK